MLKNTYPGKLILFEGGDGVGKSTQAKLGRKYLLRGSEKVVLTKEPYTVTAEGKPVHLGNEIYQVLKGEHERTRLADLTLDQFQRYFYFPNRIQHYLDVIIPALKEGAHVVSDRGAPSVCFGAADCSTLHQLMAEQLAMMSALRLPWPDAILIYDVPADVAIERMKASGKQLDGHERLETLVRVRDLYRRFADFWPNCYFISSEADTLSVWEKGTKPVIEHVFGRQSS